jgi:hypothetical protein
MKMAFVLPTDMCSVLAYKTNLINKYFGNVSAALEIIVPACIPLVLNICHCCLNTYHCGRACIDPFPEVLNCQDVNMQSLSESVIMVLLLGRV